MAGIEGSNYTFGYSPNGYIDHELLFLWLRDIFHPATESKIANKPNAWRLLIYDGHESHLNLDVLEFCYQHKILVFCLPSHSMHILQPLDVCIFSTYQHNYNVEIDKASQLG